MTNKNSSHPGRTRVKICGFTQVEDALYAANLGVDAIGLVFYPPSPRNIDVEQARHIIAALPAFVTVVGLFVNPSQEQLQQTLDQVKLDLLQFHGDESPQFCRAFQRPYIKAIRVQQRADIESAMQAYTDARGLLLDAYHPDVQGGTGLQFDWQTIPAKRSQPLILAGGLQAENVSAAIQQTRPYAIDVSSGVESAKGIKDSAKMAQLLTEVYQVDSTR